jgi:hypothetical protein
LFESNRVYLQKFSNKTRKEKRKEKRKKKKEFPAQQQKQPAARFPFLPNRYSSPSSPAADERAPHVIPSRETVTNLTRP